MIRTTIMLDDKLAVKLRDFQAKEIKNIGGSFSFSATCNKVLERGLR